MAGRGKLFYYLPSGSGRIDELSFEIEPLAGSGQVDVSVNGKGAGTWKYESGRRTRVVLKDLSLERGLNQVVLRPSVSARPIGEVRGNEDKRPPRSPWANFSIDSARQGECKGNFNRDR